MILNIYNVFGHNLLSATSIYISYHSYCLLKSMATLICTKIYVCWLICSIFVISGLPFPMAQNTLEKLYSPVFSCQDM